MTAPVRIDPTIVRVALDARGYDIVIGRGLIASLGARIEALRPRAKAFIVTDANVELQHLDAVEAALAESGIAYSRLVVPPGESVEELSACSKKSVKRSLPRASNAAIS